MLSSGRDFTTLINTDFGNTTSYVNFMRLNRRTWTPRLWLWSHRCYRLTNHIWNIYIHYHNGCGRIQTHSRSYCDVVLYSSSHVGLPTQTQSAQKFSESANRCQWQERIPTLEKHMSTRNNGYLSRRAFMPVVHAERLSIEQSNSSEDRCVVGIYSHRSSNEKANNSRGKIAMPMVCSYNNTR
jgi:hypothetical protein